MQIKAKKVKLMKTLNFIILVLAFMVEVKFDEF